MKYALLVVLFGALVPLIGCTTTAEDLAIKQGMFGSMPRVRDDLMEAYGALVMGPPASTPEVIRSVKRLRDLPPWPMDRDFAAEEWDSYIRIAAEFQTSFSYEIEQMLLSYSVWVRMTHASELYTHEYFEMMSKPMILLRVMFDVPHEDRPPDSYRGSPAFLMPAAPNGGYACTPVDGWSHAVNALSSPVFWGEHGPALIACLDDQGTLFNGDHYDLNREYRFFVKHFPHRDLEGFTGE